MPRKSVRKQGKKAVPAKAERSSRGRPVTYRISEAELQLIQKAADREPLARFSRRAALDAAAKAKK